MSYPPRRAHVPRPPWPREEVERFKAQVAEMLAAEAACYDCRFLAENADPEGLEAVEWAEGNNQAPTCAVHRTIRFYAIFPLR